MPMTADPADGNPTLQQHPVGDTVTISDTDVDTTGCSFFYPQDLKRDAVKFQLVATVDNQTGENLIEALWPSDFTFTDADGLTVSTLDSATAEPPLRQRQRPRVQQPEQR